MAFATEEELVTHPPAHKIGIDVMRLNVPRGQKIPEFISIFEDQLTPLEKSVLAPSMPLPDDEALRRFFLIWTLKEAYTKALGFGLGFDFKRIEYDVPRNLVCIDGVAPAEWEFTRFDICTGVGDSEQKYVGMTARYVGQVLNFADRCEVKTMERDTLNVYTVREFLYRSRVQLA